MCRSGRGRDSSDGCLGGCGEGVGTVSELDGGVVADVQVVHGRQRGAD